MTGRQRLPRAAKAKSAYSTLSVSVPAAKSTTAGSTKRKASIQLPSPAPTNDSGDEPSTVSHAPIVGLVGESSSVSVEPLSYPAAQASAISTAEQEDQQELLQADTEPPTKKRRTTRAAAQRKSTAPTTDLVLDELEHAEDVGSGSKLATPKKGRRSKRGRRIKSIVKKETPLENPRRVKFLAKLGFTPWPEHEAPSPEECYEANRRLVKAHGVSDRPQTLVNDNSVSGCGEVPHVLDALLRTVLSAATTNKNSANAFQGVIKRFGLVDDAGRAIAAPTPENSQGLDQAVNVQKEIAPDEDESAPNPEPVVEDFNEQLFIKTGLGTVNWYAVRNATLTDLEASITCGGLGTKKSKQIKEILNRVWEEEIVSNLGGAPIESVPEGQLTLDFLAALDYLRDVGDMEGVRQRLQSYVGVGLKTATCVMCMCLGRDVFAVDTHVHRIAKWLGWIPATASLEHACFHLDLRIPNELKYSLHNLLIRHGRSCAECKARPEKPQKTVVKNENPDEKPDEKLVTPKTKVKKANVGLDEEGNLVNLKRTKKVWTGNGLMKQTLIEVETDDEGDEADDKCCLEDLLKRERKPRKSTKPKSTPVPAEDMPEEGVDELDDGVVEDEMVKNEVVKGWVVEDQVVVASAVE